MEHCNYNYICEKYGLDEQDNALLLQNKITNLRLLNEASPKQRTPEWYQRRYNMMTASNLWQAFNTDSQRNRLIYEKCKPLDFGYTENKWINTDNPLHWGVKYEPLTALLYEKMTGAKIEEFGCIQHEKYPFIGASPDGIVTNLDSPLYGRMLEIKNIYNRDMDGIPSEAYWIQIQTQLECCNLDLCDFVETRFKEYSSETEFFEEVDNNVVRGMILYFVPKDGKSNVPLYKYMPLDISLNENAIEEWVSLCKNNLPEFSIYSKIYWYLDEIIISTIERNEQWFEKALPIIQNTWETIEHERISGYEHRAAKKRIVNDVIVINSMDGSESHIIKNMPSTNGGICLIKIDSDNK
jgi:putative phage-type endonuclease